MADTLWTAEELAGIFGPVSGGPMPNAIRGISIDTRTLQPGELFFAIEGDRKDGHEFIEQAFAAGAALAVVKETYGGSASGPLLHVPDTLEALNTLGRAGRARSNAQIIAVTGSVGKTGTKEMLRLMLGRLGRVHASDKSYNNHWGVPLSLARLPRDVNYAIFEIGMNHAGEITPLTKMVRPHAAIITSVAPVHIEFFDGIEGVAEAKGEIFYGLEEGGTAVINRDNEFFVLLSERAKERGAGRILSFGHAEEAESRLLSLDTVDGGSEIKADCLDERLSYRIGAPGEHLALNSLAALAAVKALGGDLCAAAPALSAFGAPAGRGAQTVHETTDGTFILIDESYNANPASMNAAFKVLGGLPRVQAGRRIAILGDMLELGTQSAILHEQLADALIAEAIDKVYCCGPYMKALFAALPVEKQGAWAENSGELRDIALAAIQPGDAVMIKGSLSSRMGLIVEGAKQRYPQSVQPQRTAAE